MCSDVMVCDGQIQKSLSLVRLQSGQRRYQATGVRHLHPSLLHPLIRASGCPGKPTLLVASFTTTTSSNPHLTLASR